MATVTIAATVQAGNVPPRVKLVVTDTGTPAIGAVTVTRTDPDGSVSTVRTTDGEPLRLYTSGSTRTGIAYDYVMPYGDFVTYSTVEQPTATATATVAETRAWLIHPQIPALSVPVTFRKDSFEQDDLDSNAGVFSPVGRRRAVVITDGQRKAGHGSFTLSTETLSELAALRALLDDASVLLLNVPASSGLGITPAYIWVQGVTIRRLTDIGTDPQRDVVMPYIETEPPAGGMLPEWNLGDVEASYTLAQAAALTLQQVLLGPNP